MIDDELLCFEWIISCKYALINSLYSNEYYKKIMKYYEADKNSWEFFLAFVNYLKDFEKEFLFYDERLFNIAYIFVNIHRFDDKESFDKVNEAIMNLNEIKMTKDPGSLLKRDYIQQISDHYFWFSSIEDLLKNIAYDAEVYFALKLHEIETIQDDSRFLNSVNFLLTCVPQFFDDDISSTALERIEEIHCNTFLGKRRVSQVKKSIRKLILEKQYVKN